MDDIKLHARGQGDDVVERSKGTFSALKEELNNVKLALPLRDLEKEGKRKMEGPSGY